MNTSPSRSCKGKIRHPNLWAAKRSLTRFCRKRRDLRMVAYFCRHCLGFHLGHPSPHRQLRVEAERLAKMEKLKQRAAARAAREFAGAPSWSHGTGAASIGKPPFGRGDFEPAVSGSHQEVV